MPRKFGSVNVAMWNDPEFRALPPAAQHLYLLLWTSAELSFCGVHDWRPNRLTKLSTGLTEDHTRAIAACLSARHFLVIDEDTEEVLVRSWARFDELLKQPRLAVSYSLAYSATYSQTLRSVLVHETEKMRKLWPELACWRDTRVVSILDHPSVSAKDLPTPEDPFGDGFGHSLALGLPQTSAPFGPSQGLGLGSVSAPPTPAPTPTPSTTHLSSSASTDVEREFEEWYDAYPRKRGKGQAVKAYKAARKKADAETLLVALKRQTPALLAKGAEFVPYPATWLNGERWADEPDRSATAPSEPDWMRRRPS